MDHEVEESYLRGDVDALIAIARCTGDPSDDDRGAFRALRLLGRLGDQRAAAFYHAAIGAQESSHAA